MNTAEARHILKPILVITTLILLFGGLIGITAEANSVEKRFCAPDKVAIDFVSNNEHRAVCYRTDGTPYLSEKK